MMQRVTKHGCDWMLAAAVGFVFLHGLGQAIRLSPAAGVLSTQERCSARYRAGVGAFKAGRWSDALFDFEEAAEGSTGYLKLCATNMVGQINRLEGRLSEAQTFFISVVRQARAILQEATGDNSIARHAAVLERLALQYQAEIAEERQDWSAAVEAYEQLLEVDGLQAVLERLGRLHWRMGRCDRARQVFDRLLARSPDDVRAPLIRRAVLSLENDLPSACEQKLAFLFCPLNQVDQVPAGAAVPASGWPVSMPALPELPDPARNGVDRLLQELPPDNVWRPVLLLEKGWMLFEADRWEESAAVFAEAARLSSDAKPAWAPVVRNYADLSLSISLMRRGAFAESLRLAQAVLGRNPQGQVQTLARSIVSTLSRRLQETQAGVQCDVETLK